jgi:hypothetical protein
MNRRRILRMLKTVTASVLACWVAVGFVMASAKPTASPKVEYTKVSGLRCLQPRLLVADVGLDDFRQAEQRWLWQHYPGRPWQRVLVLPSGAQGVTEKPDATLQTETAIIQADDGSGISVCFAIGLTSAQRRLADQP